MRLSRDEWALTLAEVTARRSTCFRRAVGCVILNSYGHVVATGYNGVAAGVPHCNERVLSEPMDVGIAGAVGREVTFPYACLGAGLPSGSGLEICEAIHAEQNALMQCHDVMGIETVYVTVSPCVHCVKMLANTSASRIVFRERYSHDEAAELLWRRSRELRAWDYIPAR